jgi:hypothetical protein
MEFVCLFVDIYEIHRCSSAGHVNHTGSRNNIGIWHFLISLDISSQSVSVAS